MRSPDKRYLELAEKWMNGTITEDEKKEFSEWYNKSMNDDLLVDESSSNSREELEARIFQRIEIMRKRSSKKIRLVAFAKYAAAACVAGFAISWFLLSKKPAIAPANVTAITNTQNISAPEITRAILTMADGSKIYMDSTGTGMLARQGSANIARNADGELQYQASEETAETAVYNELFVPRGSKVVNLTLSDGTKVWLNAETRLRFPVVFTKNERRVSVTGEAYFEVAKEKNRRFFVEATDFTTEVLGTHFNVNAYPEDYSKSVSLLEGSVKVSDSKGLSILLQPGQQVESGEVLKKSAINDLETVTAWKDGMFIFRKANIETIMRQLSRWYNLSVRYQGSFKDKHFTGRIGRQESVAEVLHLLELTDVIHFKIEGREVTILP